MYLFWNVSDIEVNYSDMPFLNAPVGLAPYCCYSCQDGMVTIISTSEKNEAYLAEILVVEEPDDQSSYVPAEFVMCLAKFQGNWNFHRKNMWLTIIISYFQYKFLPVFVKFTSYFRCLVSRICSGKSWWSNCSFLCGFWKYGTHWQIGNQAVSEATSGNSIIRDYSCFFG